LVKIKNAYRILVKKPERMGTLERTGYRSEDNIKMDLKETEYEDVNWICLAHKRPVADYCEHHNKPLGSIKGREFLDKVSESWLSRRTMVYAVN
jgi:hypothetical protein